MAAVVSVAWAMSEYYPPYEPSSWPVYNVVYGSTRRTVFSIALCWLIYTCQRGGRASLTNRLLGHRALAPFATLSYGVYLIHPMVLLLSLTHWGWHPREFQGIGRLLMTCAMQLVASYLYSLCSYVLVEWPGAQIGRVLLAESGGKNNGGG